MRATAFRSLALTVLKCRPPANRDPLPEEIEACSDYLVQQIELVSPLVIVTLGRYSMARFFPQHTIGKVHGRWKEMEGRFYVPMYHPAAALHQGSLRETILEDFRRLPRVLERARAQAFPPPDPVELLALPPDTTASQVRLFD